MKKLALLIILLIFIISCTKEEEKEISSTKNRGELTQLNIPKSKENNPPSNVIHIESESQFENVMNRSDSVLLVFDLYADWCNPCKILSPILEEISNETKGKAEIYKINVDKLPNISRAFGVKSIPLVVFVKNKKGVNGLVGVQPKKSYIEAINKFAFKAEI